MNLLQRYLLHSYIFSYISRFPISSVVALRSASSESLSSHIQTRMAHTIDNNAWEAPSLNLKGVFCGSGSDMMNDRRPVETILKLANKPFHEVQVLYLGTATYDIQMFRERQTQRFTEMGCKVSSLQVSDQIPSDMEAVIDKADVIVVAGGNTLYAVDRWRNLQMIPLLRKAMERGAVMTGGSAGAICWFSGGHSGMFFLELKRPITRTL